MSSTNTSIAKSVASLGFDAFISNQEELFSEKYVASMKLKDYRSFRVSEIIAGHQWPKNLQELILNPTGGPASNSNADRRITVTEITALLCHAALIEVGFVPENSNLAPLTICTMSDAERIERFGKRVNPQGYNSTASVFAWTYQVVNLIQTQGDEKSATTADKIVKNDSLKNVETVALDCNKKPEGHNNEKNYELSPPCSVIMIPKGARTQIFCNFPGSTAAGTKPFQQTTDVDLQPFSETNIEDFGSLKLTADNWMKVLNLNGMRFSTYFKSIFATLCLDAMNGVLFDTRGLVCLPPEILIRIFSYSDLKSIRNSRLTCRYLNDVVDIPALWRTLIRRDFGATPSVPTARFARFFTRIPYDLSRNIFDAPYDYRAIYEAHKRGNFRPRFDGVGGSTLANRLGGRPSWIPYVTPPRPYLFRLSYDVTQPPPTIRNPANVFFDF